MNTTHEITEEMVERAARALWTVDEYDFDADPTSRTAQEFRSGYFIAARAALAAALDDSAHPAPVAEDESVSFAAFETVCNILRRYRGDTFDASWVGDREVYEADYAREIIAALSGDNA